jgi:rubredoxin
MSTLRNIYDMACPKCGNDEELVVLIETEATLTVEGTDADGHHEWDMDSACACPVCRYHGMVANFLIDDEETAGAS